MQASRPPCRGRPLDAVAATRPPAASIHIKDACKGAERASNGGCVTCVECADAASADFLELEVIVAAAGTEQILQL